jgi:hypothetical protein
MAVEPGKSAKILSSTGKAGVLPGERSGLLAHKPVLVPAVPTADIVRGRPAADRFLANPVRSGRKQP